MGLVNGCFEFLLQLQTATAAKYSGTELALIVVVIVITIVFVLSATGTLLLALQLFLDGFVDLSQLVNQTGDISLSVGMGSSSLFTNSGVQSIHGFHQIRVGMRSGSVTGMGMISHGESCHGIIFVQIAGVSMVGHCEGGNGIIKIDPTGITCQNTIELSGVYSVAHVGKFLLAGLKDGSAIKVLDDASFAEVASITVPDADRITRMQVRNDTLYVCGAGNDSMTYNYVYAAPLTADAQAALDAQAANLNKYQQENDTGEAETEAPANTDAQTEAATEAKTDAPETEAKTEAPATTAPESEAQTEPEAKGGCGSVIGGAAIVAAIALGALVIAKKKD